MTSKQEQESSDKNSQDDSEPSSEASTSKTVFDEAVDALEFIPGRPIMPNAKYVLFLKISTFFQIVMLLFSCITVS